MQPGRQDIKVSCSTKNLKIIRDFVNDYLVSIEVNEVDRNLIVLAIDEVCANKIIHAHGEDEKTEIALQIDIQNAPSGLIFDVIDTGIGFDDQKYKEPSLNDLVKEKKKGSLGMVLVKRVMDKVIFKQEDSRNICRMVKFVDVTK